MELFKDLENEIKDAYEGEGKTPDEAEKLAAKFLYAQMQISYQLKTLDLDSRMKKTGVKAIRARLYLEEVAKADKKPSDVLLDQILNNSEIVTTAQDEYDVAESNRDDLERWYNITREAHVYFRTLAKGRFD